MNLLQKLALLSASSLLLLSCASNEEKSSSATEASSESSAESLSSSEGSSSSEEAVRGDWDEEDKQTIIDFCEELLPYPLGFAKGAFVNKIRDSSTGTYFLQITSNSKKFSIEDYYEDLIEQEWEAIKDYSGSVAQQDSSGTVYYELCKLSSGSSRGLDLVYFFSDESLASGQNVIQVYNDFSSSLDEKADWSEDEKTLFSSCLGEVPPLMQLGSLNKVASSSSYSVSCYDMLAKDLSASNAEILKANGYALDEELSKSYDTYILRKTLDDGNSILASLYFFSGNHIIFSFDPKINESSAWPKEFVSSFESSSNYEVPEFEADDIETYYYYSKGGVGYIYAYTEDWYINYEYEKKIAESGLIYDSSMGWYSDWGESYYVGPHTEFDSDGKTIFGVTFALLDEPYDSFVEGYPSSEIASFLEESSISVSCPTLDFTPYSPYSTCRVSRQDYKDVYPTILSSVKADPATYGIKDPSDEDAIEEKAAELAKKSTYLQFKIYDPEQEISDEEREEGHTGYYANDYLLEALRQEKWSRLSKEENSTYDVIYEDPTGEILVGVDLVEGVSIVTISYGSGKAHSPQFYFASSNVSLAPGTPFHRLDFTVDMLPYEITFTSSDPDIVSVDKEGIVAVSEDAAPGKVVTITASMEVPDEGKREIECTVTITKDYDFESAMEEVVSLYNSYFSLSEGDDGAAKPKLVDLSDPDEGTTFKYMTLTVAPSSLSSLEEAKSFVEANLIPLGFGKDYDYDWGNVVYEEQKGYGIEYYWHGAETTVQLSFYVYKDSKGSVKISVESYSSVAS